MIGRTWIITGPLWASIILGGCRAPGADGPRAFQTITFGLCASLDGDAPSTGADATESIREEFALIRSLNVRHVRIGFAWDRIEPVDDAFDWTHTDRLVRMASEDFDLTLLPYVHRTPEWAADGAGPSKPPRDTAEFAEFMGALADRYRDQVHSWEVWTRPDAPESWRGDAAQYAALARAAAEAARSAHPDAHIVLGSITGDMDFLRQVLVDGGVGPYVDAVGLEVSTSDGATAGGDDARGRVQAAAEIVRAAGVTKPLWLTATGGAPEAPAETQAFDLLRVFAQTLATGEVHLVAWNRDMGAGQQITPALAGFALARHVFAGAVRSIDQQLRVTAPDGGSAADVRAHAFERWDRSVVILAWFDAESAQDPGATRRVGLWLPMAKLEPEAVFDHLGRPLDPFEVSYAGTWTVIRSLDVRPGEVVIIQLQPSQ